MSTYITRRFILTVFILFSLSIIVFVSMHAIPGDIVDIMLGIEATPKSVAALKKALGLDRPIYLQYLKWFSNVLQGNLGDSLRTGRPVMGEILYRLPLTLELILYSMIISLFIATPLGIASAIKQNSWFDHILRPISIVGLSVPSFWWGILFIILISYYIPSFYSGGYVSIFKDFWGNFKAIFPPALALGIAMAAVVTRFTRSSLIEVLQEDYIVTARAKGLTEVLVVGKHGLRNSLINVLTIIGLQAGYLLSGAVLVEAVFSLPGVGRLALDAVLQRDYPMVQGSILIISFLFVMVNLVVDLLYGLLDPRIRIS
ncbi:MAG: ABC transporter permease [Desulfobacterales bacterium]|nr:MAG: ABC transporter permease [Desulfobacterales bacterium]